MKLNLLKNLGVTICAALTIIGCSGSDDNGGNHNGDDDTPPVGSGEFEIVQKFDTSFIGGGDVISQSVIQNDGKILIATMEGVFRFHSDGSLDNSFNASGIPNNNGASYLCRSIALQNDGKILLGYYSNSGSERLLFRLNENGSVDNSFNPTIYSNYTREINAILPLNDGTIIIGGSFSKVNGVSRYFLARLTQTGNLVQEFNAPISGNYENVNYVLKLFPVSNNRFMATGIFRTDVFSPARANVVVFDYNGNLDESFNFTEDLWIQYPYPILQKVLSVVQLGDGNLLLGGEFNAIMKIDVNGNKLNSLSLENDSSIGKINIMNPIDNNRFLIGSETNIPNMDMQFDKFLNIYNLSSNTLENISIGYDDGKIKNIIKEADGTYLLFGKFEHNGERTNIIRIKRQ